MFRSLRTQLSVIFLGFLLLVSGSVIATFLAIQTQDNDALVINLAGRQRMLVQKITWLALTQPESPDLAGAIQDFERTLHALRNGGVARDTAGQTVALPPAPDSALRAQLDEAIESWAAYRARLESLETPLPAEAAAAGQKTLQTGLSSLLVQLDTIVNGFEVRAEAKLLRLQLIQAAFFILALLLLAWGYRLTRRRILSPLTALQQAARRIAGGRLAEPILVKGDDELSDLGRAFESMRAEVAAARQQLEARVARRTHELAMAFEFSQEIVSQLDLQRLLHSVTNRARALAAGQAASLCLLDQDGTTLSLAARSGNGLQHAGAWQPIEPGPVAQVIKENQSIAAETACFNCGFLDAHAPGQQCVAAPLRVGEQTLGALCVVKPGRQKFDPDETRALSLLANSAAIAITNARLVEAQRRQAEQAAILTERERLAAELHDNLAQTLSFFNMKISRVKALITGNEQAFQPDSKQVQAHHELDRISAVVADTYGQVRQAIIGLRQEAANNNLAHCLAEQSATFQRERGLSVCFNEPGEDAADIVLPPAATGEVMRIIGEAIANAGKHAAAGRIEVALQRDASNEMAIITVKDNGRGFDPRRAPSEEQGHFGLGLMQTRARRGRGSLQIESAPGQGAQVTLRWPLE